MRHERKICKLQPFSRLSKQNPSNAELKEILLPEAYCLRMVIITIILIELR